MTFHLNLYCVVYLEVVVIAEHLDNILLRSTHVPSPLYILNLNGFDEELDDKNIELWSVTKALLPENYDFELYGSRISARICIVNSIILRDSNTAKFNLKNPLASECTIYKDLIQNYV